MWGCEGVRKWGCEDVRMRRCEDLRMWRCEDEKMWGCEDVKMRRCEDEKMWRWADVKMRRCEDVKTWGREDVKTWRWEDVKMWGCEDVTMKRCEDVKMWRREDVKMKRCEGEQIWRWEDVKMWRWEDVKMRRCEDVRMWGWDAVRIEDVMWRCEDVNMFERPPLLEQPFAQTLSGKTEVTPAWKWCSKPPKLWTLADSSYGRFGGPSNCFPSIRFQSQQVFLPPHQGACTWAQWLRRKIQPRDYGKQPETRGPKNIGFFDGRNVSSLNRLNPRSKFKTRVITEPAGATLWKFIIVSNHYRTIRFQHGDARQHWDFTPTDPPWSSNGLVTDLYLSFTPLWHPPGIKYGMEPCWMDFQSNIIFKCLMFSLSGLVFMPNLRCQIFLRITHQLNHVPRLTLCFEDFGNRMFNINTVNLLTIHQRLPKQKSKVGGPKTDGLT